MKKIALFTALCSLSVAGHSADWTPVFQSWEYGEDSHIIGLIERDIRSDDGLGMSWSARNGNYESVPARYRADMLPARFSLNNDAYITIPLKNATLYGLPIRSFTHYFVPDGGFVGNIVTFHPMTNADYAKLKRKKFTVAYDADAACEVHPAFVDKDEYGNVTLTYEQGC